MNDNQDLKKDVERWFKDNKELLNDLYSTRSVLEVIDKMNKYEKSIVKQIHKEMGIGMSAVSKKKKILLEHGLIREEQRGWYKDLVSNKKIYDSKSKLIFLTDKGKKILRYLTVYRLPERKTSRKGSINTKKPHSKTSKEIPISAREFHSVKIKDVIGKLLEALPVVSDSEISLPLLLDPCPVYSGGKLDVEDEILFVDLTNHLEEYERFYKSFCNFKRVCKEFQDNKHKIFEIIKLDLSKQFNLQFSPHWSEPNSFSMNMIEWVYMAAIYFLTYDKKYFKNYYIDFNSKVELKTYPGQEILEYRVEGMGLFQVSKEGYSAEDFKTEIDKKLRVYMKKLKERPYFNEITANLKLVRKASDLQNEIKLILKENLEIPIFGGVCKYLRAMHQS